MKTKHAVILTLGLILIILGADGIYHYMTINKFIASPTLSGVLGWQAKSIYYYFKNGG